METASAPHLCPQTFHSREVNALLRVVVTVGGKFAVGVKHAPETSLEKQLLMALEYSLGKSI